VTTVQCFLKLVINRTPCVNTGFPFIKSIHLSSLGPRTSFLTKYKRKEEGGLGELKTI